MDTSTVVAVVAVLFLLLCASLAVWFFVALIRALTRPVTGAGGTRVRTSSDVDADGMNPGDYYNGPHGYSPMTGYPGTQYGSGFDPDAEWNRDRE